MLMPRYFKNSVSIGTGTAKAVKVVMRIHGRSILIIDDDTAMLRALTKVLAGEGGIVTTANWAGEAIDRLTDTLSHFDLVITDLRMPILGGETILRAVKTAMPRVPVIVITAFGSPDIKADCLDKGASAFFEKPLETPQLLEAVDRALAFGGTDSSRPAKDAQDEGRSN